MELFVNIVNNLKFILNYLFVFTTDSILDAWQGSKYTLAKN